MAVPDLARERMDDPGFTDVAGFTTRHTQLEHLLLGDRLQDPFFEFDSLASSLVWIITQI